MIFYKTIESENYVQLYDMNRKRILEYDYD